MDDLTSRKDLHNYMQSVENQLYKHIDRQMNNLTSKTDLHNYMQSVEKQLYKRVDELLTRNNFRNYMMVTEKNLLKKINESKCAGPNVSTKSVTKQEVKNMLDASEQKIIQRFFPPSVSQHTRSKSRSKSKSKSKSRSREIKQACGRGLRCADGMKCKKKICVDKK